MLALHFVAATVKVTNAEVTAQLTVIIAAFICSKCGIVYCNDFFGFIAQRSAVVVAAKDGVDGAAIDGDVHVVHRVVQNGVLGAAKQGVDLNAIVGYDDVGRRNGGTHKVLCRTSVVGPNNLTFRM